MSSNSYTIRTEGQTTIHTMTWTVKLEQLDILNEVNKAFSTKQLKDGPRFELRIRRLLEWDNDNFEIHFLSPATLYLKSMLTIHLWSTRTKKDTDYHTVQANEWHYVATIYNIELNNRETDPKLTFEFMVKDNIKFGCPVVPTQLSTDFRYLLNNGMFSDVVMTSAENVEYKVHKVVLASRSAVLKARFDHNTTESITNVVESPLDSDVLKEVLTFIYSDEAPSVDQIPEKLLVAADYYQLGRLKSLCEEALYKKLTVENAIETLQLADVYSANSLKALTLKFIKDGNAELVTKTEGWARLESVALMKSLHEYIMARDVDAII